MEERTCEVEGCGRAPRSPKAALCNAHYFRKWRTGKTGAAEVWDRHRKPCTVAECDGVADGGLGLCSKHYQRVRSHGSADVVLPNHRYGDDHWAWKADPEVSYHNIHQRVRAACGAAEDHACVTCGGRARQWAYDHSDPDERSSKNGPYSSSVQHYQPMCVPCHKRFDLDHLAKCPEPQRTALGV